MNVFTKQETKMLILSVKRGGVPDIPCLIKTGRVLVHALSSEGAESKQFLDHPEPPTETTAVTCPREVLHNHHYRHHVLHVKILVIIDKISLKTHHYLKVGIL